MDMETKDTHIRRLIDRYFEGLTSLDEEKELSEYFRGGTVREEFRRLAPLFAFRDACAYSHDMPERKTGIRPKAVKALVAAAAAAAVVCAVVIPRSFSKDHDTETGIISPACMAENMQRVMELSGNGISSLSAKPAGNAALVTATMADGTVKTYIMTCDDGEGSASFIALNE